MFEIKKSEASLRIFGDTLIPEEISNLLCGTPTSSTTKGEIITGKKTETSRIAVKGSWHLQANSKTPEDLNQQIQEILSQLTDNLDAWRKISGKHKINLFCGLFLDTENGALGISADNLVKLGQRGIELQLDIYEADQHK